jgi:HSP20 family protein
MATQNQTSRELSRRGQRGSMARWSGVPSVPSLLVDPLGIFDDSPFSLLRRMQQDINRVFSQAAPSGTTEPVQDLTTAAWAPPVEISLQDGKLTVSAELPGLSEKDVNVEIDDSYLVIQGERKDEREENEGGVRRTERRYGRFVRAIALPDGADTEHVQASFQNGMLNITIPIAQESGSRQIPIQSSASSETQQGSQSSSQQQQQQQQQRSTSEPATKKAA